ncbi:MAG: toxin-antitoxin system, antitoxin component [Thiothrix lacustris]|uniref:Toxin-antitoxin system, antitoxin component n=1 Tax=Thiothrix lacustris TaxID=525917 RepID=A0A1Y1QPZ4_9GAMM|nr:MAG: toxin-antitoxin system, antitoxin component [Thiothrix lacustris]
MNTKADKEWEYLVNMPDEEIDFSDIPETTEAMWKNAVVGKFYRPIKKQVTVRIDADILAWLQSNGAGYQTRLNQVLREAMLKQAA